MKTNSLKLSVLAIGLSLLAQSCTAPVYVQSAPPPPPPVYEQAPPPPPTYAEQPPPPQAPAYTEQAAPEQAPPPVSYQSFYNELSPYGQWVSTPEYGYVWVPAAGPDFQPYASCGHWVMTNYGWTWASDYSWGWAAFHYGSWDFDGTLGWYWIPGNQWSPAWVSWRSTPGYYGWAPLGPTYVNGGYASYYAPQQNYVFVNATYINNPNLATYYEPRAQNATYFSRSTIVTNTYYDRSSNATYYAGPQSAEVERYTGTPIRPVTVVQVSSPERTNVSGNQISMFRPSVQQPGNNDAVRPVPPTVYQKNEVTPISQRTVLTRPNQPRIVPFKPENIQQANQPNEQPIRQEQQNRQIPPPVQGQQRPVPQEQQAPVQQHQAPPVQPQPPVQQHQAPPVQPQPPVQQRQTPPIQPQPPAQQQYPHVQQQQRPAPQLQQPVRQQQQPKQGKPQKPNNPQPKQQPQQGQPQGKPQQ